MIRPFAAALLVLAVGAAAASGQCDPADSPVWLSSYALRTTADTVYTYSDSWAAGPDAPYMYLWDYQSDYINGSQIQNTVTGSADPGGTAEVTRTTSVDTYGFGEYLTQSTFDTYDACTGIWAPPYSAGIINGQTSADVWAYEPTISGSSLMWLDNYGPNYPNSTTWTANAGGAPEVPTWNFVTNNYINYNCDICNSVTITPVSTYTPLSCSSAAAGYFMVGNLKSPEVGILIDGPVQTLANDPSTGQHVDNNAVSYEQLGDCHEVGRVDQCTWINYVGYQSEWWWQVNDVCGNPMGSANMHEEFPSGFAYAPNNANSNWAFPLANSWPTGDNGAWYDTISETGNVLTMVPVPEVPQSPLGTNLVYSGLQNVYVGNNSPDSLNTLVFSGDQAHYQDNGGYAP
jgi:hypothetical protein